MRIWHKRLIPSLCQKHLCAMWREGIIMLYGILGSKSGWRNHPARKEFEQAPNALYHRLEIVREEMLRRSYHPKELPFVSENNKEVVMEWQSLEEQIIILKEKGKTIKSCKCLTLI